MSKKPQKPDNKVKDFSSKIIKILSQNANKAYNYSQIAAILDLDDSSFKSLIISFLDFVSSRSKMAAI